MAGRNKLPHKTPLGVVTEESLFFITICLKGRGSPELLEDSRAELLLDAVRHRNETGVWYARLFLVMPDHVHGLIYFHNPDHPMEKAITNFKRWTAKSAKVTWQLDFFDHRTRREEFASEKADYILMNPVRAGLVERSEDWPHIFIA